MPMSPAWRTALAGAAALVVIAELVARLQGDRLCTDRPGVVYERDAALGWRHVPGLSGWAGTCDSAAVPPTPLRTDAEGFVGPPRPHAKAPGTARILLLGGNLPEAFGVPRENTMAGFLELLADQRRGKRLEVVNGATGGWALDNSLVFFRQHGAARAPDLVVLVLDPIVDLASISPAYLTALGRRVPAKPYFSLVDGGLEQMPPFALAPAPPPPPPPGPLAFSQLYRLLRRTPAHTGEPMAWAAAETFPHGTPDEERERSVDLARALLRTLRDEVAAAGGRLVTVMASLPGARRAEATGRVEREWLTTIAGELGIPLLDLTDALDPVERHGQPVHLEGSVRLSGPAHGITTASLWGFLNQRGLLPAGVVPARAPGSGQAIPALAALPGAVGDALWASRLGLVGQFIQFGLLAACVVWLAAPLPTAARDWVLAGLGVTLLWLLGSREAALLGAALVLACYGAVELLPPLPATAVTVVLLAALVAGTARAQASHVAGDPWAPIVLLAVASNVALLKLAAYAVDRRRGAPRLRLREFLAAMLFFPTLPAGPVQAPADFVAGRGATVAPAPATVLTALGRLAVGWGKFTLAPLFLALDNTDVFATRGDGFTRARLWLFVGEVALLFTLLLSGWSDVAIALARLAGVEPPENFRRPWLAADVAAFWRRWHATLAAWLRDYLYVPLGGARRGGARNVALVFLASAAWHGWGMTKILGYAGFPPRAWGGLLVWAVLNAAAVIGVHAFARRGECAPAPGGLGTAWRVAATAIFVALAWLPLVLPQLNSLRDLGAVYLRLFGL